MCAICWYVTLDHCKNNETPSVHQGQLNTAKAKQEDYEAIIIEIAANVNEVQIKEKTVTAKLQFHRAQEQAEQAAVMRNINEFSQILDMCNLQSDRAAHQAVSDTMVQLGSAKWRESRSRVAPAYETLVKLQSERKTLQNKRHGISVLHAHQKEQIADLKKSLAKARLNLSLFADSLNQVCKSTVS